MRGGRAPAVQVIRLYNPPVTVTVKRSARARKLTLRVAVGTGDITLTAPVSTSDTELSRFLTAKAGWIEARRDALPDCIEPNPGDVLTLFGEDVTLQAAKGRRVKRQGTTLLVPGDDELFRARLKNWIKQQARQAATSACDKYSAALGLRYKRLSVRDPRSRWGSCTSEGHVMMSWRLAFAPVHVLEYVAAHEVAHLRELNHSAAFWETVARLMPEFESPRGWLKSHGPELHAIRL
ncbi:MAG: SprT family zinc-dependent metalloprotease [Pseudomonadota bacterium]